MKMMKLLTLIQAVVLAWCCSTLVEAGEIPMPKTGGYSLVGMGPGDVDLLTARALSAIRNADVVFCDARARERLSGLVDFQDKEVITGYDGLGPFYGKVCSALGAEERALRGISCETCQEKQKKLISLVRKAVFGGKQVVMLTPGDPTLYGEDIWTVAELADLHPVVIPGLSAFNAANADLQVSLGEVAMTTPLEEKAGKGARDRIEHLVAHGGTTLVIFMPGDMESLFKRLSAACPPETAVAVVSHAGRKGKTTVVNGTVLDLGQKVKAIDDKEPLVYVGAALKEVRRPENKAHGQKGQGKFFLVGVGPGDPDLATLRALDVIQKANVIFASKRLSDHFQKELSGKKVIDGYHRLFPFYGKKCSELTEQEKAQEFMSCEAYHEKQAELAAMVRKAVSEGKTVALLDSGDPLIYGPSAWTLKEFRDIGAEAIPGLSSFNAANAALGQRIAGTENNSSIVLASGWSVDDMARAQSTMALFTMRTEFKKFIDALSLNYPAETPVAIVTSAGYAAKEKVLRGKLSSIMEQVGKIKLPFEYLIYVGDVLAGEKR